MTINALAAADELLIKAVASTHIEGCHRWKILDGALKAYVVKHYGQGVSEKVAHGYLTSSR